MGDIMRQNPDLMKQFANAAMGSMNGEAASAARMFTGQTPSRTDRGQQSQASSSVPAPAPAQTEAFASNIVPERVETPFAAPKNKINPPVGVDDLLKELQSNNDSYSLGANL